MEEALLKKIDEISEEMISGIKRIVQIDSVQSEAKPGMPFGEGVNKALEEVLKLARELGFETEPAMASNFLYYMKQNGVFDKIKGLWIGNYEHESGISLEKIILDVLDGEYKFPIIKSNDFGHIERKTVIPIGTKAEINTDEDVKIKLVENCVM